MDRRELTDDANGGVRRVGAGCFTAGALFAVTFTVAWLAAITLYGLIVEQWEMVRVRRDFAYDWTFVWAPLFATGCGFAVAFWATRRLSAVKITLLILVTGLIGLFGGILLFGLGGLL